MEVLKWAKENQRHIGLTLTQMTSTSKLIPSLYDFHAAAETLTSRTGRGVSTNRESAAAIAITELFERWILDFNGIESSNGCAAHWSRQTAVELATRELIERDAFFCHHLTGTPFGQLNETSIPGLSLDIQKNLNLIGIRLLFGEIFTTDIHSVGVICAAFGDNHIPPFGVVIGTSAKETLDAALNSAAMECLCSVAYVHDSPNDVTSLTLEEFATLDSIGPHEHFRFAMNPQNSGYTKSLFSLQKHRNRTAVSRALGPHEIPHSSFTVSITDLLARPDPLFGCPLHVVRLDSPENIIKLMSGMSGTYV